MSHCLVWAAGTHPCCGGRALCEALRNFPELSVTVTAHGCWWPLNLIPSKSIAGGGLMQEHWERNLPLGWLEMQWFISTLISVSEVSVCLWLSNNTWTCWLSCSLMCYWSLWLLGSSFFPCKTCSKLAAWNRSAHFVAKWFIWSFWGGKTLHFQELWASLSLWKPNRMGKSSYSVNV